MGFANGFVIKDTSPYEDRSFVKKTKGNKEGRTLLAHAEIPPRVVCRKSFGIATIENKK